MIRWLTLSIAIAAVACVAETEHPVSTAQAGGNSHVVIRAEYGRLWWSACASSEPHELWTLPHGSAAVENLRVAESDAGYVVSFVQDGTPWSGTFDLKNRRNP